ncbi:aqualysin-1-like [Glandiceps talaboti]
MRIVILAALVAVTVAAAPYYSHKNPVDGSYIVGLKDTSSKDKVKTYLEKSGLNVAATYRKAFHIESQDAELVKAICELDDVLYVEEDALFDPPKMAGARSVNPNLLMPWGHDRIDQKNQPLDGLFEPVGNGKGIDIYVFSTGIDYDDEEFEGRATNFFEGNSGTDGYDCWDTMPGGTSAASVAAGQVYGVAKEANILSVQIANCQGQIRTQWFMAGVDAILAQNDNRAMPGVCFMGGYEAGSSATLTEYTKNLLRAGYFVVGASGDSLDWADNFWPGVLFPERGLLITGGTQNNDRRDPNSNHGQAVEIWAPGNDIPSITYSDTGSTLRSQSNSVLAAAHTAGVVAIAAAFDATWTNEVLECEIENQSTKGVVLDILGDPLGGENKNKLLYCP